MGRAMEMIYADIHKAQREALKSIDSAEPNYPSCPICWSGTDWEGDYFDCSECGLSFDTQDFQACYTDDGALPCGAVSLTRSYRRRVGHYEGSCVLPAGHKRRNHYHPNLWLPDLTHTEGGLK